MDTCILEIGTEAVRLLRARSLPGDRVEMAAVDSEAVVLGASIDATAAITPNAMQGATAAVVRLLDVARSRFRGAGFSAVAPHALGNARNAHALVETLRRRHGVAASVLSRRDTARLVYRGARAEIGSIEGQVAVVHLGDAGLDFASGTRGSVDLTDSLELGVARLHRAYGGGDSPLPRTDASALFSLVRLSVGPAARRFREWGAPHVVFTGASVAGLRTVARAWNLVGANSSLIGRMELHALASELLATSRYELEELGIDPSRTGLVATAAVVLDATADLLSLRESWLGTGGPAEGAAIEVLRRPEHRMAAGA